MSGCQSVKRAAKTRWNPGSNLASERGSHELRNHEHIQQDDRTLAPCVRPIAPAAGKQHAKEQRQRHYDFDDERDIGSEGSAGA
jgi:hypothetical protein